LLVCSVRACGRPLSGERTLVCERGHAFDRARSGYVNLLQPQDRRSRAPGDSREVVAARRRLLDAGFGAALEAALRELARDLPRDARVLDVGCGEGRWLDVVTRACDGGGFGCDISVPAIDAAVRRHPGLGWLVVNADRGLPFADGSFDCVLSITGRRNPAEMARVLGAEGQLVVAVPGVDDLHELRSLVLGEAHARERFEPLVAELGSGWRLLERREARGSVALDRQGIADALAGTYRGARRREAERADALDALAVTTSHVIGRFAPRAG
jgi:23S rRNA (guanine745-N1)-methyltransferase